MTGTLHHYRLAGRNGGGTTSGADQTFTTAACPPAGQGNIYPGSARAVALNAMSRDMMNTVRTETWYRIRLFANRSYQISAFATNEDGATGLSPIVVEVFSNPTTMASATALSPDTEGLPGDLAGLSRSISFRPASTGAYLIRVLGAPSVAEMSMNVVVRETTLFSPWFAASPTYNAYYEIHNTTNQPVLVTLQALGSSGTLVGIAYEFTIPARATVFKRAVEDLQVTLGAVGGTMLTHAGAFGAIVANTTTVSDSTGLSFDAPFTPRDRTISGRPVR